MLTALAAALTGSATELTARLTGLATRATALTTWTATLTTPAVVLAGPPFRRTCAPRAGFFRKNRPPMAKSPCGRIDVWEDL